MYCVHSSLQGDNMSTIQDEIASNPWLKPYLGFLSKGVACNASNEDERLAHFYQHIQSLRTDRWGLDALYNRGSFTHRTVEDIKAIRRHVVFWHRPNQQPFARYSDIGKSLEACEACLQSPKEIIWRLIATETEKPDTILGVHVDALVTLDYIITAGTPMYSIVVRMCPPQWFPSWINDQNLLEKLYGRRIPVQSRQVIFDTDHYEV